MTLPLNDDIIIVLEPYGSKSLIIGDELYVWDEKTGFCFFAICVISFISVCSMVSCGSEDGSGNKKAETKVQTKGKIEVYDTKHESGSCKVSEISDFIFTYKNDKPGFEEVGELGISDYCVYKGDNGEYYWSHFKTTLYDELFDTSVAFNMDEEIDTIYLNSTEKLSTADVSDLYLSIKDSIRDCDYIKYDPDFGDPEGVQTNKEITFCILSSGNDDISATRIKFLAEGYESMIAGSKDENEYTVKIEIYMA